LGGNKKKETNQIIETKEEKSNKLQDAENQFNLLNPQSQDEMDSYMSILWDFWNSLTEDEKKEEGFIKYIKEVRNDFNKKNYKVPYFIRTVITKTGHINKDDIKNFQDEDYVLIENLLNFNQLAPEEQAKLRLSLIKYTLLTKLSDKEDEELSIYQENDLYTFKSAAILAQDLINPTRTSNKVVLSPRSISPAPTSQSGKQAPQSTPSKPLEYDKDIATAVEQIEESGQPVDVGSVFVRINSKNMEKLKDDIKRFKDLPEDEKYKKEVQYIYNVTADYFNDKDPVKSNRYRNLANDLNSPPPSSLSRLALEDDDRIEEIKTNDENISKLINNFDTVINLGDQETLNMLKRNLDPVKFSDKTLKDLLDIAYKYTNDTKYKVYDCYSIDMSNVRELIDNMVAVSNYVNRNDNTINLETVDTFINVLQTVFINGTTRKLVNNIKENINKRIPDILKEEKNEEKETISEKLKELDSAIAGKKQDHLEYVENIYANNFEANKNNPENNVWNIVAGGNLEYMYIADLYLDLYKIDPQPVYLNRYCEYLLLHYIHVESNNEDLNECFSKKLEYELKPLDPKKYDEIKSFMGKYNNEILARIILNAKNSRPLDDIQDNSVEVNSDIIMLLCLFYDITEAEYIQILFEKYRQYIYKIYQEDKKDTLGECFKKLNLDIEYPEQPPNLVGGPRSSTSFNVGSDKPLSGESGSSNESGQEESIKPLIITPIDEDKDSDLITDQGSEPVTVIELTPSDKDSVPEVTVIQTTDLSESDQDMIVKFIMYGEHITDIMSIVYNQPITIVEQKVPKLDICINEDVFTQLKEKLATKLDDKHKEQLGDFWSINLCLSYVLYVVNNYLNKGDYDIAVKYLKYVICKSERIEPGKSGLSALPPEDWKKVNTMFNVVVEHVESLGVSGKIQLLNILDCIRDKNLKYLAIEVADQLLDSGLNKVSDKKLEQLLSVLEYISEVNTEQEQQIEFWTALFKILKLVICSDNNVSIEVFRQYLEFLKNAPKEYEFIDQCIVDKIQKIYEKPYNDIFVEMIPYLLERGYLNIDISTILFNLNKEKDFERIRQLLQVCLSVGASEEQFVNFIIPLILSDKFTQKQQFELLTLIITKISEEQFVNIILPYILNSKFTPIEQSDLLTLFITQVDSLLQPDNPFHDINTATEILHIMACNGQDNTLQNIEQKLSKILDTILEQDVIELTQTQTEYLFSILDCIMDKVMANKELNDKVVLVLDKLNTAFVLKKILKTKENINKFIKLLLKTTENSGGDKTNIYIALSILLNNLICVEDIDLTVNELNEYIKDFVNLLPENDPQRLLENDEKFDGANLQFKRCTVETMFQRVANLINEAENGAGDEAENEALIADADILITALYNMKIRIRFPEGFDKILAELGSKIKNPMVSRTDREP
jgi:hypothetical protein